MNMTLMVYIFISLVLFKMLIMTSQNSYKMSQNLIKIYRNLYNLQHKSYTLYTISGNCSYFFVTNFCICQINDHILKYHEYFCDVNIPPWTYGDSFRLLSLI